MIRFGTMRVEGFASIADEKFDWGLEGLNIIQAPNGFGKTKFINALVWVLFGKTLQGSVEPWAHTRGSSYVGTRVEVNFTTDIEEVKVMRYKNYPSFKNSLVLGIDGDPFDGDKNEAQAELEKMLGYSYELFKNSIIFGQKLKRIISESGPNKKKVFDEAFEVLYLQKAKKLAEEKRSGFILEESKALTEWSTAEEKVRGKKKEIDAEQGMVDSFEEDKKKEIKKEREAITPLRLEKRNLSLNDPDIEETSHNLKHELEIFEHDGWTEEDVLKKEKELTKLEGKLERAKEDKEAVEKTMGRIEDMIKNVPTECFECGRAFSKEDRIKESGRLSLSLGIEKENKDKLLNLISTITGQIKEVEKEIASANECLESIAYCKGELERLDKLLDALSEIDKKIQGHKDKIQEIKEKKLKNNIEKLTVELSGLKKEERALAVNLKRIQRDLKLQEWLIKDPLSNAGLKAFIFNMMLDDINERLEFYTKFIGFQVAFMMDMKSAHKNLETYVFQMGEPVPYDDLSGGQQQAVDIATAFAIHDVVSDSKECALLVMDEVFESLDKDNIEIMTELIQDKAQDKCLYVVTHRAEFNPTNANLLLIDYHNGITSVA
jgi:DNA repair exonuclease SbcCD ATPase subunit